MDMKEYIVTCKSRESLQSLYNDMETEGGTLYIPNREIELVDRREVSRNTHYKLTEDEAELISNDNRVLSCALSPTEIDGVEPVLYATTYINPELYPVGAEFTKQTDNDINEQDYRQWGHLHSAGSTIQRRKNSWGTGSVVTDNVDVYNDGRHVDVVIVDGEVGFDSNEWESEAVNPSQSRMKQYDWYAEHPTVYSGGYGYPPVSGAHDHGMHVAGTVAGKYYGWAKEANIYSLTFNGPHGVLRIFDFLREFHKNKPVNPVTGRKNPTISNNSWGFNFTADWDYSDVNTITFRGQTYDPSSPGPSGWTNDGIHADFGIRYNPNGFPLRQSALDADIEDAIEEGIVVVGAAGNANHYMVREGHQDYDNWASINGLDNHVYMHRGSSPGSAKGVICVGAQDSSSDHRRAQFTNYGDRVDVFAPGEHILSVGGSGGYAGTHRLKGPITRAGYPLGVDNMLTISGTSMASPQVCGILACAATNRERFTNDDAIGYIRELSRDDGMDFDTVGVSTTTYNANIDRTQTSSQGYYIDVTDVNGNSQGFDPTITINHNDTLNIILPAGAVWNHPLYIRDSNGNNIPGVIGQGFANNATQVTWTPGVLYAGQTVKYQCGNHSAMEGSIIVLIGNALGQQGGFDDVTCSKESPNREVFCNNPRPTSGYVSGWKQSTLNGRRRTDREDNNVNQNRQVYPRVNGFYKQ